MKFREALKIIDGLRFVADELTLMSALGRSCLMNSEFISDRERLSEEYGYLAATVTAVRNPANSDAFKNTRHLLMQTHDIHATLERLFAGKTADDVELFEIKGLALLSGELKKVLAPTGITKMEPMEIPELDRVYEILDPEKTGNAHFHIYDAYSGELADARGRLRRLQSSEKYDTEETDRIIASCMIIEGKVREELSENLKPFAPILQAALEAIGRIDLLLAKADFVQNHSLSLPVFRNSGIQYSGLRYLPVESMLRESGRGFQPVDITLREGVTLITGANMGGKTITLKSLAMAQAMAQYCFGVPASEGKVMAADTIAMSGGDGQSASEGLSSFGAEILKIDSILSEASGGVRMLILIDEPARTTNPEEGRAIVSAIIEMLMKGNSVSVLTTHYSNIKADCPRLRVKGVRETLAKRGSSVRPGDLSGCMDYALVADDTEDIDREALTIARLLGISRDFSETIEKNINKS